MTNFCTSSIADLEQYKNQDAAIAGIVTTVEHRVSKNGKPIGTFSIEDFTGTTELVLFGEDYLKMKHFLSEGTMLFVKGKYQLRYNSEDRYELKIVSIQLLQDIRERLTKRVTLNVSLTDVNDILILKIEDLLTKNKGNFPVAIQVNDVSDNFSLNFNAQKAAVNLSEEFMQLVSDLPEVELKLN